MSIEITFANLNDEKELLSLYESVVNISDGIIRQPEEVSVEYIHDFLLKSINNGLILVAKTNEAILGEIHAYTPNLHAFQHILTDLTIVVHADHQGKGIGRKLFERFLKIVTSDLAHIRRIELYTREHNERNVKFYESLGFINEGRQENKIFIGQNQFETPIHMAWLRNRKT